MPGVRTGRDLAITIDTRNDLLFTMSDNTYLSPAPREAPRVHHAMKHELFLRTNLIPTGGARRDRTDDLLLAKQALSQLSYGPRSRSLPAFNLPPAAKPRSSEGWWAWEDLNFRPHAYQARALTN